jgi:hypothetical protein
LGHVRRRSPRNSRGWKIISTATLFVIQPTAPAHSGIVRYCHHLSQKRRAAALRASVNAARRRPSRYKRTALTMGVSVKSACNTNIKAERPKLLCPATATTPAPVAPNAIERQGRLRLFLLRRSTSSSSQSRGVKYACGDRRGRQASNTERSASMCGPGAKAIAPRIVPSIATTASTSRMSSRQSRCAGLLILDDHER